MHTTKSPSACTDCTACTACLPACLPHACSEPGNGLHVSHVSYRAVPTRKSPVDAWVTRNVSRQSSGEGTAKLPAQPAQRNHTAVAAATSQGQRVPTTQTSPPSTRTWSIYPNCEDSSCFALRFSPSHPCCGLPTRRNAVVWNRVQGSVTQILYNPISNHPPVPRLADFIILSHTVSYVQTCVDLSRTAYAKEIL